MCFTVSFCYLSVLSVESRHPLVDFTEDLHIRCTSWKKSWSQLRQSFLELESNWQANVNPNLPTDVADQMLQSIMEHQNAITALLEP
ncbi:hypothetical protein D915_010928, partial [Fasciola hepatica]